MTTGAMAFEHGPFNEDPVIEKEFLILKETHGIKTVVETGTYCGVTAAWLAEHFEHVKTVEISEQYHGIAIKRLEGMNNVTCTLGNSKTFLEEILPDKQLQPFMFFLDAHWYHHCPLLQELDAIAAAKIKPVIAIHDFKVPQNSELGYDTYKGQDFDLQFITAKIQNIYGRNGYSFYYNMRAKGAKRGIIYIFPKK